MQARDGLRVEIRGLSEERRAVYDELTRQDREPQLVEIVPREARIENTRDAENTPLPRREKHLQADADGNFPVGKLNDWELAVVDSELARPGIVGWYRNPSNATTEALQGPYRLGTAWNGMQPDFIFFSRKQDSTLAASIVDPHGDHLADALPKLKGLARFAELYGDRFLRIEAVSKVDGELRMLDVTNPTVRTAIKTASSAADLYRSGSSESYL